jgi:hypothetical protein
MIAIAYVGGLECHSLITVTFYSADEVHEILLQSGTSQN